MGPQTERWLRTGIVAIALLVTGSIVVAGVGVGDQATVTVELDGGSASAQAIDDERNLSSANASYSGTETNDTAGWSVAEAGDVNGDGETDFLVGAPRRHDDNTGNGTAYLFYGPVEDGEFDVADANVTFEGPEQADRTGVAVAGGDVDGDGYADVVIGASHANSSERYAGAVYVVSGGDALNETVHLADANATLEGEAWGDHAGYAVDVVNDTTGSGSDVVVGAPYNNSVNRTAGAVYLLQGGELDLNGTDELSLSDVGTKYAGEGYGDRAGWSVADAGDVNGDGLRDVVVGAYGNDTGANGAGAAYVIYGDDSTERESDASLADADAKLVGVGVDDGAGYAVDGAGDVNADGYADIVVGAPYSDAVEDDAGAAYLLHGGELSSELSLDEANLTLYGENEDAIAGFAVGGGPCDERVFVGAPGTDEATGAAHVVAANATGTASLADATATLTGEARGDGAGFSLAGAANLSGEDTRGLLVGAPYADSNANDSGTAYLVNGVCPTDEEAADDEPIDTGTEPRDEDERADDTDADERADDDAEAPDEPADDEDTPLPKHDDPPERPDDRGDEDDEETSDERTNDTEDRTDRPDDETDDVVGNDTGNETDGPNGTDETDETDDVDNETDGDRSVDPGETGDTDGDPDDASNDTDAGENVTNETDADDDTDQRNGTDDQSDAAGDQSNETDGSGTDENGENGTETEEPTAGENDTGEIDGSPENDGADGGNDDTETDVGDDAESNESAVVGQYQSDNETESEEPTTEIQTGTTVSGDERDAETRRFEFEADDGEAIRVTLPGGTGDVRYTLYGPDGEQIAQGVPTSDASAIGGVADESGTYYVEATAPGYDVLGQYRFRVSTSSDDAYEGNDDRSSAASVPTGEGVHATLFEGEDDWYAVELSAGETYLASFQLTDSDTELGNNVRIEMYDESGERVTPTDESGPAATEKGIENRYWGEQTVEIDESGTYYVRLTGADEPGSFDGYEEYDLTVAAVSTSDAGDEAAVEEPTAESDTDGDASVESSDGENATDENTSDESGTDATTDY